MESDAGDSQPLPLGWPPTTGVPLCQFQGSFHLIVHHFGIESLPQPPKLRPWERYLFGRSILSDPDVPAALPFVPCTIRLKAQVDANTARTISVAFKL